MDILKYNETNIDHYIDWTKRMSEGIHNIGKTYSGKKGNEIGLKGFVFLDILQRIAFNLHGLATLFIEYKQYQDVRFSINLIFRSILSDVLNGLYLAHFTKHAESFENEVLMLDRDFAQFAKFIIENETALTKQLTEQEIDEFVKNHKDQYVKENPDLFQDVEAWQLRSPHDIRKTSDSSLYFGNDHLNGPLTDPIKIRVIENNPVFNHLQIIYVLYRYFSQYHHYSFRGRSILKLPNEYDMLRYYTSFMMMNEGVKIFCIQIEAMIEDMMVFKKIGEEMIIKE